MNTRNSCRILREHGLRPAKNCIRPDDPTITIELSDQEMDSPSPEPEDQTASTRSIQDHITEKTSSEKSPSRVPTPPETIDITDEDALFYGDDFGEDDISGDEEDGTYSKVTVSGNPLLSNTADNTPSQITRRHGTILPITLCVAASWTTTILPPISRLPRFTRPRLSIGLRMIASLPS